MGHIDKGLRDELEKLLAPAEEAFSRAHSARHNAEGVRERGGNPERSVASIADVVELDRIAHGGATTRDKIAGMADASAKLALATARQEAHGVVIGLRAILDRSAEEEKHYTPGPLDFGRRGTMRGLRERSLATEQPCAFCGLRVAPDEAVSGEIFGPRGIILHDGEVAHATPCFGDAKARA